MAISKNITMGAIGAGRKAPAEDKGDAPPLKPPARGGIGAFTSPISAASSFLAAQPPVFAQPPAGQAVAEAPAPPSGVAAAPVASAIGAPTTAFFNPALLGLNEVAIPPRVFLPPLVFHPVDKTTTQIAQGAMNQLRGAAPAVIREAVNNIKNKNIAAGQLLNTLERRTRVGEVLNELANDWSAETKADFAEAFQMPNNADKLPVMDAMVSIAILNDPDLKNELLAENTHEGSQSDLLENRRIVWQWPQPGTAFTPPYLIMVAVEREDTSGAQKIIDSVIGDLVDFQGFKIPTAAANKLR